MLHHKACFTIFLPALHCDQKCIYNNLDMQHNVGIEIHNTMQAKYCEPGLSHQHEKHYFTRWPPSCEVIMKFVVKKQALVSLGFR